MVMCGTLSVGGSFVVKADSASDHPLFFLNEFSSRFLDAVGLPGVSSRVSLWCFAGDYERNHADDDEENVDMEQVSE